MNVTVRLFASFRIKQNQEIMQTCRPGSTILNIVSVFGLPDNESFIVELNGASASLDDSLHEGDVLSLVPLVVDDTNR
jgi:molybdopterin converting factor small subunit